MNRFMVLERMDGRRDSYPSRKQTFQPESATPTDDEVIEGLDQDDEDEDEDLDDDEDEDEDVDEDGNKISSQIDRMEDEGDPIVDPADEDDEDFDDSDLDEEETETISR